MEVLVISLFVSLVAINLVRQVVAHIGLTDRPDHRKLHGYNIPLVGGIGLLASVVFTHFFLVDQLENIHTILVISYLVFILGLVDDRWQLDSLLRLFAQIALITSAILITDIYVRQLDTVIVPGLPMALGAFGVVFTVFCLTGVVNATNMIDGVDGLLGAVSLVTITSIFVLALSIRGQRFSGF